MAIATVLAVIDIAGSLVVLIFNPSSSIFGNTAALLFIEFASMLVLGGCMMAREPLDDDKKYDKKGSPVSSWRIALMGRRILLGGLFAFVFSVLFSTIGTYL